MQIHILLIGLSPDLAKMLSGTLKQQGYRVSSLIHQMVNIENIGQLRPDLLLMSLPSANSLDLEPCRYLATAMKKTPIMLIGNGSSQDQVDSLNICANDYLSIPIDIEDFLARVRARVRRINWEKQEEIFAFEDLLMNTQSHEVYYNKQLIPLTLKEFELLKYFMEHPKQVLTHQQIMNTIWPDFLSTQNTNILHVYIRYLRQKLKSAGKFIQTIRNVGYMLSTHMG
ncbi:MAG: response regulator transcription factor [Leptolyngbyaceae cyanobacterium]